MSTPIRILVLEDDLDMREALAETLSDEGYEVVAVGRGLEAVEQASKAAFDLIVSDVRMEGMSGLDTIEQVKRQQPDMGSLVVSGWASEEETLRAVRLNVGGYLKKPFPMQEFLTTVRELLEKRAREQQRSRHSDSLQRALDWSIAALTRLADHSALLGPQGSLEAAGHFAARLARHSGLAEEVAQQVRWLTLFNGLRELPQVGKELPSWLVQEAQHLPWVATLDDAASPLSEISRLARQSHRAAEELLPSAANLEEQFPGQFSPKLLQIYESMGPQAPGEQTQQASQEVLTGLSDPSRIDRSLLSLAHTLEESGDVEAAQQAYTQVRERSANSREGVQALLGCAHLSLRRGDPRQAAEWAQQAAGAAAPLGPVAQASAQLESGLILQRAGSPAARPMLEQAAAGLAKLGMVFGQSQACVMLARLGSETAQAWLPNALEHLADPLYSGEFAAAAPWLVAELLELPHPPPRLYSVVLTAPRQLLQILRKNLVAAPTRQRFAEAMLQRTPPEEVVAALEQDEDLRVRELAGQLRGGQTSVSPVRLHVFGFFEVIVGEQKVPEAAWKTQKTKYLLAFLSQQPGKFIHEDQLLEAFWPDDVTRGKRNLYAAISIVRRLLRPEHPNAAAYDYITRERESLSFNWELPHWSDLEQLEVSAEQAARCEEAGRLEEAIAAWRRVAQLYSGPYLDGSYLDWVLQRREELENLTLRCLCRLAFHLCQRRHYQEALEHSTRAVILAPYHQEAQLMKMRSLLGLGQPEAVLRQFAACERLLRQDYGIEPNTELVEVSVRARHGMPDSAA